ncbi:MAG TPA: histidine kinase [Usitatibacteraceae bacterium]|nr:histidine kinase [Usitatibacteraceae bacterium]
MNRYAYLFEGLTLRRVLLVSFLCVWAAAATVWFFVNTYLDLLVSSLCVGYTSMVLFTVATNLRQRKLPRWAVQVLSIVVGSFLGTMLAGIVKGRDFATMFSERFYGVLITMGLGIGFGAMAVWVYVFRERESRHAAELARAQAERAQLEKNVLQAQLALMQAQVEPHFLFNTLANVQHLVETDPASASRMLESLIQYLRAALPRMREDATTVGREADMARAFLDIHRMRMGSRLDYVLDVPEALRCRPFPPMMLISLVENAIKHGVDPCCEAGTITIRAREEGGKLRFSVADTGEGISPRKGTGVGLVNIRERLKALHGSGARLLMEENTPHGVIATIEVDAFSAIEVPLPASSVAAPCV